MPDAARPAAQHAPAGRADVTEASCDAPVTGCMRRAAHAIVRQSVPYFGERGPYNSPVGGPADNSRLLVDAAMS
ncbi:hypothetical protein LIG30_4745 [Burkholderia sp. lig30]|nr:hypothetical protein LIG30_4745 [Burkholderia sp. lig30]